VSKNHWHIITPEYPPQIGGVSDYTASVAEGLAKAGQIVHVWSRFSEDTKSLTNSQIRLHPSNFNLSGLKRLTIELDQLPSPKRFLIQYVPHGYGYKAMNLAFVWWVFGRKMLYQDSVELMFHEVGYPWVRRPLKHNLIAAVNRAMAFLLTRSASRVFASIPAWVDWIRVYANPRVAVKWLPIPSACELPDTATNPIEIRNQLFGSDQPLIAHFGTYGKLIRPLIEQSISQLLQGSLANVLLLGQGAEAWREEFLFKHPEAIHRVQALGRQSLPELVRHLQAVDMVLLPYPDGISTRRTSAMLALAHGVPVITNRGHLTESVWSSDVVGLAEKSEQVAKLAIQYLGQPEALKSLGLRGQTLYRSRFAIYHTVKALLEFV
jgi:glycosyltransferase involved in cell wall biosynthesis